MISVERKILVGFAAALVLLAVIGVTSYRDATTLGRIEARRDDVYSVIHTVQVLMKRILDVENAQRRYVITGEEAFLPPFQASVGMVARTIDDLRSRISDPAQLGRIGLLEPIVEEKLAFASRAVVLREMRGFEAARNWITGGRGRNLMEGIRQLASELEEHQRADLVALSAQAAQTVHRTRTTAVAGGLLAVGLVGIAYLVVLQGLAGRRRAAAERERALGEAQSAREVAERHAVELTTLASELESARAAAVEASRFKSEFLANMSHEIRTPMTAILGYADLLTLPDATGEERAERIETIRRNGTHLLAIINDVLDLSKLEAGKMTLEEVDCSPVDIVSEVVSLLEARAEAKGLTLEMRFDGPIPERLHTDPTRLRQILLNLVGNAVKFTERGGVCIVTRTEIGPPGGVSRVHFAVRDTGIGIGPAEQGALFEVFHQADPSMTRRFGGSGLGLALSKRLAEMLGGGISLESELGSGSTFTVSLDVGSLEGVRLVEPEDERRRRTWERAEAGEAEIRISGRVLVAEDGLDIQRLIAYLLRRAGADVETAANGLAAYELAMDAVVTGHPFDVVLMDMQMPELDGYGATRRLRDSGYRGTVVALTAHAMEGSREECLRAGCDEYLSKPVSKTTLLETVARLALEARERSDDRGIDAGTGNGNGRAEEEDDDGFQPLVSAFVQQLPVRVQALEVRLGEGDLGAVGMLSHQLKGAAGMFGFGEVSEAAARLEMAARSGECSRALVSVLRDRCQAITPDEVQESSARLAALSRS